MKMKKTLLLALAAMAALSGAASASIVTFEVNASVTQGGNGADFGGCMTTTSIALTSTQSLNLDPGCSGQYLDLSLSSGKFFASSSSTSGLKVFNAGDVLSNSTFLAGSDPYSWTFALIANAPQAGWNASFNDKYLGFRSSAGNYGFIEADWAYNNVSHVGTLSLGRGMLNTTAYAALAVSDPGAAVPEPGSLALLGLALAACAVMRLKAVRT